MMGNGTDFFKDYVYRGADAILRFASYAGNTLREKSEIAIEKLDARQLRKKQARLYNELGVYSFRTLSSNVVVSTDIEEVRAMVDAIAAVHAELECRKAKSADPEKSEKK